MRVEEEFGVCRALVEGFQPTVRHKTEDDCIREGNAGRNVKGVVGFGCTMPMQKLLM